MLDAKVFTPRDSLLILFFFFLAALYSLWDPGFPTRDGTRATTVTGGVLTTGPPGNSPRHSLVIPLLGCIRTNWQLSHFLGKQNLHLVSWEHPLLLIYTHQDQEAFAYDLTEDSSLSLQCKGPCSPSLLPQGSDFSLSSCKIAVSNEYGQISKLELLLLN